MSDDNTKSEAEALEEEVQSLAFSESLEDDELIMGDAQRLYPCQGTVPECPVTDWKSAKEQIPDLAGYIVIPGAGITAELVRGEDDNAFYDCHDIGGNENSVGAAHIDVGNGIDFMDPNTVIYGSNIPGGVFEALGAYSDRNLCTNQPFIYFFTEKNVSEYRIFASGSGDETNILQRHNCYDYEGFTGYVDSIYSSRGMDAVTVPELEEAVKEGWRVVTLSAGKDTESKDRYFVYAAFSGTDPIDQ
jgi:hypothetical protein